MAERKETSSLFWLNSMTKESILGFYPYFSFCMA